MNQFVPETCLCVCVFVFNGILHAYTCICVYVCIMYMYVRMHVYIHACMFAQCKFFVHVCMRTQRMSSSQCWNIVLMHETFYADMAIATLNRRQKYAYKERNFSDSLPEMITAQMYMVIQVCMYVQCTCQSLKPATTRAMLYCTSIVKASKCSFSSFSISQEHDPD